MAKSVLTKIEWACTIFGAIFLAVVIVFSVLHSKYFADDGNQHSYPVFYPGVRFYMQDVGNAYKLRDRCLSAECMEAAAWLMGNMDDSVDPCESLYDRTCGNYAEQHPFKNYDTETSVLSNMREINRKRIEDIISSTPMRTQWGHMYETAKMVNNFFQACIDQYQRTVSYSGGNNPLIPMLLKQLGTPWWVNDPTPSRLKEFDWQVAMRATARDQNFVFFKLQPLPKGGDVTKNVLEITYDQSPTFTWQHQLGQSKINSHTFRAFLVQLGTYLARDNGTNTTSREVLARLDQFADDVINVTARISTPIMMTKLFEATGSSRYRKTFTYSDFKAQPSNNFVQWDALIDAYTESNKYPKMKMRRETPVVEHLYMRFLAYSYSSALSRVLADFNRTDPNFQRKMNNYFVFRIAFYFMPHMNYEYNHLYQMYHAWVQGVSEFPDDWETCMNSIDDSMPKTLSALYVAKFYRRDEEKTVQTISQMVRTSLIDEISQLPWMDKETRQAAVEKLKRVNFKIGKPLNWVSDDAIANEMATLYGKTSITPDNHFKNVKELIKVLRDEEIRQLTRGSNPYDHWRVELYETHIEYYSRWNEVLIPAGILQPPIVSPSYPAYMNFGGLGSWIASTLLSAVDEEGQVYNGDFARTDWWTNKTWTNYNPMKQTVIDFYDTIVPTDLKEHLNTTAYAPLAISETGGLRQAYKAYKRYLAENRLTEQALPSLAHGNVEQMFFYSYASTHCADYSSYTYAWRMIYGGIMPEFIHVNGGVGLMKEFGQAFQCRAGSAMIMPESKKVPLIF